jgi:hypothetical protein
MTMAYERILAVELGWFNLKCVVMKMDVTFLNQSTILCYCFKYWGK